MQLVQGLSYWREDALIARGRRFGAKSSDFAGADVPLVQ